MKNKILLCLSVLALIGLTACTSLRDSVPATQITGTVGGKPFTFTGPKDLNLGYFQATANATGDVSVTLSNLTARTNPDVITTTGDAQAKLIAAQADAGVKLFNAGIAAAAAKVP